MKPKSRFVTIPKARSAKRARVDRERLDAFYRELVMAATLEVEAMIKAAMADPLEEPSEKDDVSNFDPR